MDHLAILNWALEKAGISGTTPTDVTGLTGAQDRMVDYVDAAWLEIQNHRDDWNWMCRQAQLTLTADQSTYTYTGLSLNDVVAKFNEYSFWLWSTVSGEDESLLTYHTFEEYVARWGHRRVTDPTGASAKCTQVIDREDPSLTGGGSMYFLPPPAGDYQVRCLYTRKPENMGIKTYTPDLPAEHHLIIAWYAIYLYAAEEANPELASHALSQYQRLLTHLSRAQSGPLRIGNTTLGPSSSRTLYTGWPDHRWHGP